MVRKGIVKPMKEQVVLAKIRSLQTELTCLRDHYKTRQAECVSFKGEREDLCLRLSRAERLLREARAEMETRPTALEHENLKRDLEARDYRMVEMEIRMGMQLRLSRGMLAEISAVPPLRVEYLDRLPGQKSTRGEMAKKLYGETNTYPDFEAGS